MGAAQNWRGRALTLEAGALLIVARLLVARVPLRRWRGSLGTPAEPAASRSGAAAEGNRRARYLARAVARAAARLPGESLCLPQAMALQWLLRRRGLGGTLMIGVSPGHARGDINDLHAWVVREGEVLIGISDAEHLPVYAATYACAGPSRC